MELSNGLVDFSTESWIPFRKKDPVTLLVPEYLRPFLSLHLEKMNLDMNKYLWHLLRRYAYLARISNFPSSPGLKTSYQAPGQALIRYNFRVEPLIWHGLKCIARAHGVSICMVFVALVLIEQKEGVPTKFEGHDQFLYPRKIQVIENMDIKREKNSRKLEIIDFRYRRSDE